MVKIVGWLQKRVNFRKTETRKPLCRKALRRFQNMGLTKSYYVPNLCLNLQAELCRTLWHFPALLRFLFGTLLDCLFQPPLSAFGICVGLNSVY